MKFLVTTLITVFSCVAHSGIDVGNGGDLVKCVPHAANPLYGLYSLDYLVFSRTQGPQPKDVQSWQESIYRVRRIFVDKIPELLPVFDEFVNNIMNEDQTRSQVWEPTDYELTEINDEDLPTSVQIPVNCRDQGKIQLVQAVVRQKPEFTGSKLIVYKYMPKIFEKMEKERPLQLSFLLVHEFLWSISDNVDRNRRINWFLHSEEIEKLSRLDVIDRLLAMGLEVKGVPRILDANGRGHFITLQEALSKARAGETILIKEGTYTMSGMSIVQPINLIGEGRRGRIVIKGSSSTPALNVSIGQGQVVRLENLSLLRTDDLFPDAFETARAIEFASRGKLVLKDVIIQHKGEYIMDLRGHSDIDFENVIMEGDDAFFMGQYYGNARLNKLRFISHCTDELHWFGGINEEGERDPTPKLVNSTIEKARFNGNGRIWERWDLDGNAQARSALLSTPAH